MDVMVDTVTPVNKEVVMKKPELVLVGTGPREFRWQSTLPITQLPQRLRETAERIEEQIADGQYDELLELTERV